MSDKRTISIVDRLRFDATRCELQFSKGVAGNIAEAADELERLQTVVADQALDIVNLSLERDGLRAELDTLQRLCDARQYHLNEGGKLIEELAAKLASSHRDKLALWDSISGRGPKCRDCADCNGRCQNNGQACDPQVRALEGIAQLRAQVDTLQIAMQAPTKEEIRLREQLVKERDFRRWVDTWVANPIGSYSVSALDGLFKMARDKIAALTDDLRRDPDEGLPTADDVRGILAPVTSAQRGQE